MANLPVVDGKFKLAQPISGSGVVTTTLDTDNTFVDKKIVFETTTPAGEATSSTGTASATSTVTGLLGSATDTQPSGDYLTAQGTGVVSITGGWINTSSVESLTGTKYYPLVSGTYTVSGGALSAGQGHANLDSLGLSNGSGSVDSTKKIALTTTDASGYYELEASGSGEVSRAVVTKQNTKTGVIKSNGSSTAIASATETSNVGHERFYVKQQTVTGNINITPSTSAQTVTFSDGYTHESKTVTVSAMGTGAVTTSVDNSGMSTYFNTQSTSSGASVTLTPKYTNTAGYISAHATATNAGGVQYYAIKTQSITETTTTVSGSTATRGVRTEGVGWNATSSTLNTSTFANSATSGTTYVDISATTSAPTLVSGDYLYINKGWTDNVKISLSKLVPDGSNIKGHADKIVTGYTAYDNDGSLITGSLPVYAGAYSVA